ncbi:sigma-54 dependent transcriptional regulator [Desulfovibrio sp. OttesenSCG-928-A18]|nr:sigma-54 dependent transcriptional regulator [Desulfovibrio sp. OttesenSCG-928-A18]
MSESLKKSGKNLPHHNNNSRPDAGADANTMRVPIHSEDTPELGVREFVFRSPAMRAIYSIALQVAGSDASVLVYGESGTGKELFARLLHTLSDRNARPFVPVNCGILQGELFADKFFGHEAGAFTGAARQHKGAFEGAANGTLFLDEVGEIPPANQVDFLRVLEERSFRRMGGEKDIPFQARIVAATNRPLNRMVREGAFRADLFYRLNVVPVALPPLRARSEDIPLLAEHAFSLFRHRYHRHDLRLHDSVLDFFLRYSWPGNVRELRNLMERLVLLAKDDEITAEHLPLEMRFTAREEHPDQGPAQTGDMRLEAAVREAEIRAIVRALKHSGGKKKKAASLLDISERALRYKLARYAIGAFL